LQFVANRRVGDIFAVGTCVALRGHECVATVAIDFGARVDVRTRASRSCPVFWIDPHARLKGHPLLPQALGCDFAVHRQSNGAMTTGALFFHQTESTHALLDIWQRLTRSHPDLPESFLLDQAWTLATSQRQIETARFTRCVLADERNEDVGRCLL